VPLATLQAAQALLQDAQRGEEAAIERERALQARIEALHQELGRAEGELVAVRRQIEAQHQATAVQRRKPPAWWVKLFGGRDT
jgi:hypothetical protein